MIPTYLKHGGEDYVLVSHAARHVLGASDDALLVVFKFLKAFRPNDTELHEAIAELLSRREAA